MWRANVRLLVDSFRRIISYLMPIFSLSLAKYSFSDHLQGHPSRTRVIRGTAERYDIPFYVIHISSPSIDIPINIVSFQMMLN